MADLSSPFGARLQALVARLGTDHEGEQLACVRAIRRLPAARRLNFTDLAGMLAQPERARIVEVAADWTPTTWHELARWIVENDLGRLRPRERAFVATMTRRLVMGAERSERHAEWLRDLFDRLVGEA